MTTWTALTLLDAETDARGLGEALEALEPAPAGVGLFELEDGSRLWEVGAYFDMAPDGVALALLAAAHGARGFVVSELPETDWVAKVRRDLSPVEAGRFFVHGSHDADRVPEGRVPLLIEASMAFGTGHHGTTLGCLRALDGLAEAHRKQTVLDLGCGTAVLAMAAAHLWPEARVLASDIDPVAVEVAEANLEANGLTGRITTLEAAGFDAPALAEAAPYDLVIANILKGPLMDLAGPMADATAPGGHAILSGLLTSQAEEIAAHYAEAGYDLVERADIGEWSTLILVR